jgi:hypothetical protein
MKKTVCSLFGFTSMKKTVCSLFLVHQHEKKSPFSHLLSSPFAFFRLLLGTLLKQLCGIILAAGGAVVPFVLREVR